MGNNYNVIVNNDNNFLEQLKVSDHKDSVILAIYLYPRTFPNSGLIVVTNKCNV
jgi:hypothetical protein